MPDQDQADEIAALKARLEALEGPSPKAPPTKGKAGPGCGVIGFLVVLFGFIGLVGLGKLVGPQTPSEVSSSGGECDQAWATEMVTKSQALGLIEHMDVQADDGFIAVVNGGMFLSLSYGAKEQLAVAIDCQIAGDGKHLKAVRFRRSLHGADLAEYRAIDLMKARERYAADGWARR